MAGASPFPMGAPSYSGGDAGASGASSGEVKNYIYNSGSSAGAWLFISMAAVIVFAIWKKKK